MERKRKLPARAARVESVSKKRTSTPPEHTTPAPPPPPVEEPLLRAIVAGKPLPTIDQPQPVNLSTREFQSISESGVLAESLTRSRQTWLSEGIFERYWTKPSKKKSAADLANNPAKETMTKLGTCTITVEPHIFDAVMYAIKDPNPASTQQMPQQPLYRPIIQYGPPNGMMPPPAQPPVQQKPLPPAPSVQQLPSRSPDTPMKMNPARAGNPPQAASPVSSRAPPPPAPRAAPISQPPHPPPPSGPPPPTKSTDPVIQMLAERAATDLELKALMRIVANGEASPEELKKFQSHIDELTRLLKSRQAAAPPPPPNQPPQPPAPATVHVNGHSNGQVPSPAPVVRSAPLPPPAPTPEHHVQPQPQALRSKGPLPSKPDISGIVFEFTGGSGDRFLFPKYSILEYLPGGQVIASFLIVRKGSRSDSPAYDPQLDYYQPITIRLYTHQGRQLDSLQKVVAPPEEVRRYMDDIMDNMTRAEYVLLAMRLPKDVEQGPVEKEEVAPKSNILDNQVLWTTTNPTPVQKVKPPKKMMTEEEQYQSFITSVS